MIYMKLIIGLGNPGEEFEKTPHNVGTFVLKEIIANQKMADFELNKSLKVYISENNGFNICLPQTYMNESGGAVLKIAKHFKVKTDNIMIAHDDSDLAIGDYKIQYNRGSAGHKGVESIIKSLGGKRFWRLRIGIRPGRERIRRKAGDFVLKKFSKKELEQVEEIISNINTEIYRWLAGTLVN